MHHTSDPTETCLFHPNLNQPALWNPTWYWVLWFLKVSNHKTLINMWLIMGSWRTCSLGGGMEKRSQRGDGRKEKTVRKNKNREKEVDRTEQMKEIGCSTCASHEWCRLVLSHHMFYAAFSHHWTGRSTSHGENGKHQPGQLKTKIS